MSKFERVLTDDELWAAAAEVEWQGTIGQYRLIEQAVLEKLAEQQEPVAWVHPDDPDRSITHNQKLGAIKDGGAIEKTTRVFSIPAYAHPMPSCQVILDSSNQELPPLPEADVYGYRDSYSDELMLEYAKSAIEHYRTTKNHIPDIGKMVTPLAQRKIQTLLDKGEYRVIENATVLVNENWESEMQELLPLPKPNCRSPSGIGYFDSFTKDQMIDYAKNAIDHHRTTKNHIADKRKMVPEGWQLVPAEPTDEMIEIIAVTDNYKKDTFRSFYKSMLAAAPKYTGENT